MGIEEDKTQKEIERVYRLIDELEKHHTTCKTIPIGIIPTIIMKKEKQLLDKIEACLLTAYDGSPVSGKEWTREQLLDKQREAFNKILREQGQWKRKRLIQL